MQVLDLIFKRFGDACGALAHAVVFLEVVLVESGRAVTHLLVEVCKPAVMAVELTVDVSFRDGLGVVISVVIIIVVERVGIALRCLFVLGDACVLGLFDLGVLRIGVRTKGIDGEYHDAGDRKCHHDNEGGNDGAGFSGLLCCVTCVRLTYMLRRRHGLGVGCRPALRGAWVHGRRGAVAVELPRGLGGGLHDGFVGVRGGRGCGGGCPGLLRAGLFGSCGLGPVGRCRGAAIGAELFGIAQALAALGAKTGHGRSFRESAVQPVSDYMEYV